jgi:hypothetical protein
MGGDELVSKGMDGFGGCIFPRRVGGRDFGVGAKANPIDFRAAKASATCCGVNLALAVFGVVVPAFDPKWIERRYLRVTGRKPITDKGAEKQVFCLLWGEPGRGKWRRGRNFSAGVGVSKERRSERNG